MKTASDYRKNAKECRALARRMKHVEQREQLLAMAQTWDQLAAQRDIMEADAASGDREKART